MIKFVKTAENGAKVIGFGLSEGNIKKLKLGQPILVHLDDLGIEGIDVVIHYGETEDAILQDFRKGGLIP